MRAEQKTEMESPQSFPKRVQSTYIVERRGSISYQELLL